MGEVLNSTTEFFDECDDQGLLTGNCISRACAHAQGLWHRTAHLWVVDPVQGVLFQKRAREKESFPGYWDISAAGHISAGQSSKDTAVREAFEELGLVVDPLKIHFLFELCHEYHSSDGIFHDREFSDIYIVHHTIRIPDLVLQPGEVDAICFIEPQHMLSVIAGEHEAFVPHEEEYRRIAAAI